MHNIGKKKNLFFPHCHFTKGLLPSMDGCDGLEAGVSPSLRGSSLPAATGTGRDRAGMEQTLMPTLMLALHPHVDNRAGSP